MYSLRRRTYTSLIIPLILLLAALPTIINTLMTSPQAVVNLLGLVIDLFLIYILSVIFLSVESLVRIFITDRENPISIQGRQTLKGKNPGDMIRTVLQYDNTNIDRKITHSVIFQATLAVVAFFAVTSSGSTVGSALALAIFLQTLIDQIIALQSRRDISNWFWQIEAPIPRNIQGIYVSSAAVVFLVCLAFAFR